LAKLYPEDSSLKGIFKPSLAKMSSHPLAYGFSVE